MSSININPLAGSNNRVVVKPADAEEKSAGGIIIPDSAKEKSLEAEVVALGTGKKDDNGKAVPFNVKKGDKVLLPQYGGTAVKVDGVEYILVDEDAILGVIA